MISSNNLSKVPSTTIILVAANVYPIIGILFFDWKLLEIGLIYAGEGLISLFYSCLKTLIMGTHFYAFRTQKPNPAVLALKLFWMYLIVASTYIFLAIVAYVLAYSYFYDFLPNILADGRYLSALQLTSVYPDFQLVAYPLLLLLISHAISFISNFILRREYSRIKDFSLWGVIVSRFFIAFAIVAPFTQIFALADSTKASNAWILTFIAIKIIFDVFRHRLEHVGRTK